MARLIDFLAPIVVVALVGFLLDYLLVEMEAIHQTTKSYEAELVGLTARLSRLIEQFERTGAIRTEWREPRTTG